ncbi:MAG: MFS transporter [Thermosphaera sp.]
MAQKVRAMQPLPPLRNVSFLSYWLGQTFTALGDALIFVALPFVVFEITGGENVQVLALALVFGTIPRFAGVFVGSLVDRLPLRLLLQFGSLFRALVFGMLAVLLVQDLANPTLIYVLAFLNGSLAIFVQTTGNVLVPQLVDRAFLPRANSLMQIAVTGVPLLGYGLAGIAVATIGTVATLFIAAACFTVLPLMGFAIRFPRFESSGPRSILQDVSDGITLLFRQQQLLLATLTAVVLNAEVRLLSVLIPGAMANLDWGARGYGLFQSLFSGGVLLGLVLTSTLLARLSLVGRLINALGFATLSYLLFAVGEHALLFFAGALLLGTCSGIGSVVVITMFQFIIRKEKLGRVLGVFDSFNAFGFTLGPLLTGWLITFLSDRQIYSLCAALLIALGLMFLSVRRSPATTTRMSSS